jgi:nitrite reductase (NO-forming)
VIKQRTAALALALALLLAACGGGDGDSPGPDDDAQPAAGEGGDVEIDVVMGDIFYQPTGVEIASGAMLTVNASNEGAAEHDFEFEDGQGTGIVAPGESATGEFGPFEESTVAFCTVPGHREAGMEFDITVTD